MTIDGATSVHERLMLAVLAPVAAGGPRRAAKVLLQRGRRALVGLVGELPDDEIAKAEKLAHSLSAAGVNVLFCDEPDYPARLRQAKGAPPVLFYRGAIDLLSGYAVGICGARSATEESLKAARACGEDAASAGISVVSGYAKGVDTESHLAALRAGGRTVAVLAEGILNFQLKRPYRDLPQKALDRLLVVSQFPPGQSWTAGAAMTRNQVIVGLGDAVIVVEAGETGGTLRAGETAVSAQVPLWVLGFRHADPPGNRKLLGAGGRRIANRVALSAEMRRLAETPRAQRLFD
ncbi:hypothetical protein GCM10027598_04760 [Amycolatopsis oliviviridis]|uniref:Smf/DprA SLOG domain-containing protein n=1 Tax=Amycolatopsis oliviviridis TaxID=1471590 RepID=A0ABQ3LL32_9PSEU|nr:DNA-processing protein DprA [Amycolatopsis oliviviridis]GHH19473.1 hypothetical protein GCM10017790_38150 [Amycolatopsis oliviviridis]